MRHLLKDEGKAIGSRFKNTVYFFRSGSGSLVTVTDQRVDSRKRQSQPYATTRTAISYLSRLRFVFFTVVYLYSLASISTRLDLTSASRRANRALSMLDSATFCYFRAGTHSRLPQTAWVSQQARTFSKSAYVTRLSPSLNARQNRR